MASPLFSVIILGYNTAKYLKQCLDSVMTQTYADFEALVVVEESTDDSLELARRLCADDSRFTVFSKPCSGSASASRNLAIDKACGDYLLFVDGDDWIEKDTLERFAAEIVRLNGADVIMAAIQEYYEQDDGSLTKAHLFYNMTKDAEGQIYTGKEAIVKIGLAHCYQCLSLYRRQHLLDHQLYQLVGCQQEDSEWMPRVFYFAERIGVMFYPFYNYRRHKGSVQSTCAPKILFDVAKIIDCQFTFEKEHDLPPEIRRVWHNQWLSHIYWYFFNPIYKDKFKQEDRLKALRIFMAGDKAEQFKAAARDASLPKKLAVPFVLLAARHGIFWPVNCYFRFLYFPLSKMK